MAWSLRYIFDERLPSTQTDTEQVLNNVAALVRRGIEVELVIPQLGARAAPTYAELCRYYEVEGDFGVRLVPPHFEAHRPLHKLSHSISATRNFIPRDSLVYTRNLSSVALALWQGYRVVYDHFRPWPNQYPPMEPFLRRIFCHPRLLGLVMHSQHCAESYRRIGVPTEKIAVIYNGFEPRRLEPRLSAREARERLGLPVDRPLAVYAGRVNATKGLDIICDMAVRSPDVLFALVGSEGEGSVERLARGIPNIRLFPWQPFGATLPYLFAADVLLVPPSSAPLEQHGTTVLPMKLFLYLAIGRAILAPAAPDTSELLKHDRNAVLTQPGNAEAAAGALKALLQDPQRMERLGRTAREEAAEFTWDARAAKIEAFVNSRLNACPAESQAQSWSLGNWTRRTGRWSYAEVLRYMERQ